MAINRSGYSVGDRIKRGKSEYVVTGIKQRPKIITTRRIIGNTIGNKKTFKY